jgi:hypothetical protein
VVVALPDLEESPSVTDRSGRILKIGVKSEEVSYKENKRKEV